MGQHKIANQTHEYGNTYYHDTGHTNHKEMNTCTNTYYANYQIMQTLHTNVKATWNPSLSKSPSISISYAPISLRQK